MGFDQYIIMDLGPELGAAFDTQRRRGAPGIAAEILVSRRDEPVAAGVSLEMTSDPQAAADARGDPWKRVSPAVPVSLVRPLKAAEFASEQTSDPVEAARADGTSWGVADVLGPSPQYFDGTGVKVAVLDTGIDADHAAFAEVREHILGTRRNFTASPDHDANGHGTHCAATIVGRDVDGVRIGVAKGVTDVLVGKVLDDNGSGTTKSILEGLKWAHSEGANIVSLSIGFDFPGVQKNLQARGYPPELATSIALTAFADNLIQFKLLAELMMASTPTLPGMIVVAASGNESHRERRRDFVIQTSLPAAAAQGVVSVGAAQQSNLARYTIANFSNVNPMLSAPGVGIVSAATGGGLTAMNGTSMACPHVAGVAALWWAQKREFEELVFAADVVAALRATAHANGFEPHVTKSDRGTGVVRAPQA